jgi:hypothetical protein
MKLFTVPRTAIRVIFRTRGEHRPPHVHVMNREVPWEAKVRFSFVEDHDFEVLEIDPEANEPSASTVRDVLAAISAEIVLLRRRWWETFGTTCLEGKWVRELPRAEEQPQFEVLKGWHKGAMRAEVVVFDPASVVMRFTLADGRAFEAMAGQGRDLSDRD